MEDKSTPKEVSQQRFAKVAEQVKAPVLRFWHKAKDTLRSRGGRAALEDLKTPTVDIPEPQSIDMHEGKQIKNPVEPVLTEEPVRSGAVDEKEHVIEAGREIVAAPIATVEEIVGENEGKNSVKEAAKKEVNKQRLELREFSKSTEEGKAQRSTTAQEIWDVRNKARKLVEKLQEATTRKQGKEDELNGQREELAMIQDKIDDLNKALINKEVSTVKKIMDWWDPSKKRIKEELLKGNKEELDIQADTLKRHVDWIPFEISRYDAEVQGAVRDREWLRDTKDILKEFYETQKKQYEGAVWTKRNNEEVEQYKNEYGTVEAIAKRFDCYFVHGTAPNIKRGHNNDVLQGELTWEDKVAVTAVLAPTLCASTIRPGYGVRSLWSPIGVVLSGGRVEGATGGDGLSGAVGLKERRGGGLVDQKIKLYQMDLDDSITIPPGNGRTYNELATSNPEIAGLFINLDADRTTEVMSEFRYYKVKVRRGGLIQEAEEVRFSDVFETADYLGMPVFTFKDGRAYEATLDPQTGSVINGREITPTEMLSRRTTLPPERAAEITNTARNKVRAEALI